MRNIFIVLAMAALAGAALGQYHGGVHGGSGPRTYGSPSGFGNILFPGTGAPPGVQSHPLSITDTGFASRLAATVSGYPGYTGAPSGGGRGRRSVGLLPYAVPIYAGGYPYQPEPPVVVVNPQQPAQQQAPQVIINQYYTADAAKPVVREYGENSSGVRVYEAPSRPVGEAAQPPASRRDDKPTIYLLAFRDNSIQSALAYWLDGDTLHYVTVQGSHNKASVDLIDRDFSEQLNRERGLDFKLKAK